MITDKDGFRYLTYEEYSQKYGLTEVAIRQRVHRGTLWVKKFKRRSYIWENDVPDTRGKGRPKGSKNKPKFPK